MTLFAILPQTFPSKSLSRGLWGKRPNSVTSVITDACMHLLAHLSSERERKSLIDRGLRNLFFTPSQACGC